MCSKTAVAPLDRIKILLQAHNKHYKHLGVFSGLRHIVHKETFFALYKGNGAQMVFSSMMGSNSHIGKFLAGAGAGVTAVTLTYPLDTIRARLAFQVTGEHVYTGIEGGVRALYRGFVPTVCGMIPYAGFSFYCFEMLKYLCMKYIPQFTCQPCSRNTGAVAQSVSYPLDVTRRRMQLAMMNPETRKFGMGMVSTIVLIYKENGVFRGLYRGMSINYLRAIPMVAVSFSTYELLKQMLDLDTGMKL
ncbi:Graves disease carrier protein [Blattella germanica]|nr:Graves disease carrier protein [Blattella germanica]